MYTIRHGLFETNSSSSHTLTLAGEVLLSRLGDVESLINNRQLHIITDTFEDSPEYVNTVGDKLGYIATYLVNSPNGIDSPESIVFAETLALCAPNTPLRIHKNPYTLGWGSVAYDGGNVAMYLLDNPETNRDRLAAFLFEDASEVKITYG